MIKIIKAVTLKEIDEIRSLFMEYASSLDFNLEFQDFENELKSLPGKYAPPEGKLYLALYKNKAAGCIAVRKIDNEYCEMKRLFVRPEFRGLNIGRALTEIIINEARKIGYKFMRLDTVRSMTSARKIYKEFGFKEIPAYCYNPVPGAVYMELNLRQIISVEINLHDFLECSIHFNPWKHHKNFIRRQIIKYSLQKDAGFKELKKNLLLIGKSQMDLYMGELTIPQIMQNISCWLVKQKVVDKESYKNWLKELSDEYRNIKLPDDSEWTLRLSGNDEKFIHIHPARYSLNTLRVRAATLQSAIAAVVLSRLKSASPYDINIINESRRKFLGEPPVKTIYKNSGLGRIILLLEGKN
jgi:ribosomal protein S18 acetylase RimI-like enzyme